MPGLVTKAARANIDQQRKFIMINTLLWLTFEGETLLDALHFFCCRAAFSESIILVIRLQFESKMILKLRLATTDANDRRPPGTAGSRLPAARVGLQLPWRSRLHKIQCREAAILARFRKPGSIVPGCDSATALGRDCARNDGD